MSIADVKAAANGRWPEILPAFGIAAERLQNRHGPCPMCGGKDRFRFDDKGGDGTFYCNVCNAGDGFKLVGLANGWDCSRAFREVAEFLDVPKGKPDTQRRDRRSWLRQMMRECVDPAPVAEYLHSRGLSVVPDCLRYHPNLEYTVDGQPAGNVPAMLAVVNGADGSAQGINRTYLADVTTRKKLTPPVSTYTGGAIRLMPAGDAIGIAEGIETAIAVHEMSLAKGKPLPMWAAGNTSLLGQFQPPKEIRRVEIFADHDTNFAGHAAAYKLAHRLSGLDVRVHVPKEPGDWLDVWAARK